MKAAGYMFAAIIAASCSVACAKGTPKETVTIVEHESSTTPYNWEVDGRMSVSCYGNTCNGYFTAPRSGTQQIQGAILMLKRSDSSIVVARCVSKVNVTASLSVMIDAMNAGDPNSPTVYRDCREPAPGSIVEAEFRSNTVKLFWHFDGVHHVDSETYAIVGYLKPSATVQPDSLPTGVAPKIEAFPNNRPALQTFTYPSEGFSAFFPAKPEVMKNKVSTPSGPLELHYYTAQDSGVKFIVMICDYGAQSIDPDAKLALVKTHFMTAGGFIDREKKIALGQYPGVLVEAEDKSGAFYTVHAYIVGSVLYEVRAVAATHESFAETADLLNSFQLIPRASY